MDALKTAIVLLVEDDLGDRKLVKKALANLEMPNELYVAASGEGGLEYLQRSKSGDAVCPRPNLILLDLNMPGMGGKEFLRRIKADDELDTIPVVILTTSDSEQDMLATYKLQAAGYIKKPPTLNGFREVFSQLQEYWFVICKRVPREQLSCTAN
jgi:CheY-like chemotaxis protein